MFQASVRRALTEIDPNWGSYEGLIVCGSHYTPGANDTIERIRYYREAGKPVLGICWGHQLAAIEYARNVLKVKNATSEEFGRGTLVVRMRQRAIIGFRDGENWWTKYDVDPTFLEEWHKPPNMVTVPYHPEHRSKIGSPHPVLVDFINIAKEYAGNK